MYNIHCYSMIKKIIHIRWHISNVLTLSTVHNGPVMRKLDNINKSSGKGERSAFEKRFEFCSFPTIMVVD